MQSVIILVAFRPFVMLLLIISEFVVKNVFEKIRNENMIFMGLIIILG